MSDEFNKKEEKNKSNDNTESLAKISDYLTEPSVKKSKSILKDVVLIKKSGLTFEIPLKEILIFNTPHFKCKRCGNLMFVRNGKEIKIPERCGKCNVKYWFVSREELKEIGRLKKNVIYSLRDSKLKVLDFEPKRKRKVKREVNDEW